MADLLTLTGITPLDKRKQGAEATSFKNPQIGMYYGKIPYPGGAVSLGTNYGKSGSSAAARSASQDQNCRKQMPSGKSGRPKRAESKNPCQ